MNTHADKTQESKSQSVANTHTQQQSGGEPTFKFVDNRSEAITQRKLQEIADNSQQAKQLNFFQEIANNNPQARQAAQLHAMANNYSSQQQQPIQKKENNTGLPDNLKSGIENLSGYSMDDVKVHYNSGKPAQLQAHAYAQGTEIHLASGQEKHLPHEAWHVVQQKQGRVKPTTQLKAKVNVNDDTGLEKEADVMGAKASNLGNNALSVKESMQLQGVKKGINQPVQRTIVHVNQVADRYNDVVGHNPRIGPYGGMPGVAADLRLNTITRGQFLKMQRAFNLQPDGMALPVDHQGTAIAPLDANDPAIVEATRRMAILNLNHANHAAFMNSAIQEVTNRFGAAAEMEFWKGGHIVFEDNGAVYQALQLVAAPIATRKADGSIKNKTEFAGMTATNYGGYAQSTQEQRAGSMMERRPGPYKETSHYGDLPQYPGALAAGQQGPTLPVPPQYGVDMPEAVQGHVLFGMTPTGHTFIQTEGAGFQNFFEGLPKHLWGFIKLKTMGTQTGMTGTSTRSEQGANPSDLREADNHAQDSITRILDSIV